MMVYYTVYLDNIMYMMLSRCPNVSSRDDAVTQKNKIAGETLTNPLLSDN